MDDINEIVFETEKHHFNDAFIDRLLQEENIIIPKRMVNELKQSKMIRKEQFYQILVQLVLDHTSYYLFPNDYVNFYAIMKEKIAHKNIICHLSSAPIKIGEQYYEYHPFIENLSSGKVFTIEKNIYASLGYQDLFPKTIGNYEEWFQKMKSYDYYSDEVIDFYSLSQNIGEDGLTLIELKKNTIGSKKRRLKREIRKLEIQLNELLKLQLYSLDINQNEINKIKQKIKRRENKLLIEYKEN